MSRARPAGHDILDVRGSSEDRRRRREWMLSPEAGFGGNGKTVPCNWCGRRLRKFDIDRSPICGHDGGRYTRDNIVPSCRSCNINRCEGCKGARRARGGLLDREKPDYFEEGAA